MSVPDELQAFRDEIDALDDALIELIARRYEIVKAVGHFKAKAGLAVVQSERAELVKESAAERARKHGLEPEFIRDIYARFIDHAHKLEHDILDKAAS